MEVGILKRSEVLKELFGDLVVIGSGPSGQNAAIQAAKLGKRVVMIEQDTHVGGGSLNRGTIPSKTLREAIVDLTRFHERSFYSNDLDIEDVTISHLNHRLNKVLDTERRLLDNRFRKNQLQMVKGKAHFTNELQLQVSDKDGNVTHEVLGDHFVIATGSQPRNPEGVPFDGDVILDSTTLLEIDEVPKSMLVLGGGVIGAEYASFFSALDCEVTVIDRKDHMLPFIDSEIGIHLQMALTDLGLKFVGRKTPLHFEREVDHAVVTCDDGTVLKAEKLLYALGRVAAVEGLGIENAGIFVNDMGYIPVNALFQTCQPHIYAVGDVIGGPCLSSTSMEQGRLAVRHAFGKATHYFPELFPYGIYTIPEISSVGLTEEQIKKLGFHYEVGRAYYYELSRAHIAGSNVGMFKILFHSDTLEILGVHVIGRGATEVIHIGMVAMTFNAKVDYFIDQVFNYPTFAEGYRIAALNGLNKVHKKRNSM